MESSYLPKAYASTIIVNKLYDVDDKYHGAYSAFSFNLDNSSFVALDLFHAYVDTRDFEQYSDYLSTFKSLIYDAL